MLAGFNHIALLTEDLDRFIAFYTEVFDATVTLDMTEGELRHAWLDIGGGVGIHAFTMAGNAHGRGSDAMFDRGHLDHLALGVADEASFAELRRRLVERGATDGTVTDFGVVKTCFFRDPDGMECEIALSKAEEPRRFEDRGIEPYEAAV